MTTTTARLLCGYLVFVAVDVGLSFVFWIHGADLSYLRDMSLEFDIFTSLVDLFLMSLLRSSMIVGAVLGFLSNPSKAPQRLRNGRLFFNLSCMVMVLYTIAKLLLFWERVRDMRKPWFWASFVWTMVASVSMTLLLGRLGRRVRREDRKKGTRDLCVNHVAEDGETEPLLVSNGHAGKGKREQDDDSDAESDDSDEGETRATTSSIRQLIRYSRPDIPYMMIAFVALLVAASSDIFLPLLTGQVINGIVVEQDFSKYVRPIIILAIISLVSSIATGVRGGTFTLTMARLNIRIRNKLFTSIMSQEIGFFDTSRTGDITSRLTSDTTSMSDALNLNINIFLRSTVKILGFVVIMVKLSWQLTIVTFVGIPLIIIVSDYYGKYYEKLSKRLQDSLAEANNVAEEAISTMRTVRSFANEHGEAEQYADKLKVSFKLWKLEALVFGTYAAGNAILETAMIVLTLYYGGHLVIIKVMSGSQLISFLLYQMELGSALDDISNVYTGLMQAAGASAKVFEMINREPKMSRDGEKAPEDLEGKIEFRNVSFSYPSRPEASVLKNISFTASPGEIVTLVGPSGGGKSTCVSLLERFYDPTEGQVLLDGTPLEDYDHRFVHNKLSLVGQEPILYARAIDENVAYGLTDCPTEDIQHACQLSNAHTFVTELPSGYKTQAGEKGTQLSGGQKQRIAIARALVRNPKVLILDEATSALDAESEHAVQEAITEQSKDRTVIIVAHRLSTIKKASKIIVIDKGAVAESGTHPKLIARDGIYARLVKRQLLGDDTDTEQSIDEVFPVRTSDPVTLSIPGHRHRGSYFSLVTEGFFSARSLSSTSYGSINAVTPSCSI